MDRCIRLFGLRGWGLALTVTAVLVSNEGEAEYVDQACLGRCLVDCGSVCTGRDEAKNLCIGECRRGNARCESSCTRPGSPPPLGSTCVGDVCTCPPGQTACGGRCVNPTTDSTNCGACGVSCAVGATCITGACSCLSGETLCGGRCVDLTTDPKNCGKCGFTCSNPIAPVCCAGCWYSMGRPAFCW
jgi:hypothetical protein